jgi:signal transduction histidine kinase
LLSNAAKFSEPKRGRVEVKLSGDAEVFRVAVIDNGPGIPPDQATHVFEKFHQVTDQQKGKPKGTGLGLAITRLIVEHHGGRIWVEDTSTKGTCFMLTVPRLQTMGVAVGGRAAD